MKKEIIFFLLLLGTQVTNAQSGTEFKSNHLTHFELQHCHQSKCYRGRGEIAFLPLTNDTLSVANVSLEVIETELQRPQVYRCHSFSFDLTSQFLICNNEDQNLTSLTIDSKLAIKKYVTSDGLTRRRD